VLAPNLSDARERLERSLSTPIVRDGRPLQLPGMPDRPQRGGALRAILGRANRKGEVLLTMIVTDPSTAEWLRPVARGMVDGPGGVVGVSLAVRAGPGDALLEGGPVLSLAGRPGLIEEVDGVSIPVLPDSFFQVQPDVAESMTRTAGAWIGQQPGGPILDVYCGTGLFGLTLARHTAGPIVGVDHDAQAVAAAAEAAAHQGLPAEFVAGAPAVVLDAALRGRSIAAAILDPPRSGCRPSDLVAVLERRPRTIVAVSCHAPSLARDAQRILEAGYVAGELLPADMMPQTPHLEWMACFRLDAEGPPRP
jgi:23S rRNA (uracil1939-C5)-methyltransferase